MNKHLVIDVNAGKLVSVEELEHYLIEEIKRDTIENITDENIVKNNFSLLVKLFEKKGELGYLDYTYLNFLIEELELFGYEFVKIRDIKEQLYSLKEYYKNFNFNNKYYDELLDIDRIINSIETKIEK